MRTLLAIFFLATSAHAVPAEKTDPNPLRQAAITIFKEERKIPGLLRGAESTFVFANPDNPQVTERAVLYLHGFSASTAEMYPLAENLARRWKANAYLHRFAGHGFEGREGLRGVRAQDWVEDARTALARAKTLGRKVIVIASSTGASSLVRLLAQETELQKRLETIVLVSPNFRLKARSAELLTIEPTLGKILGAIVLGPYRCFEPLNPRQALWWTTCYPYTAAIEAVWAAKKAFMTSLEPIIVPSLVLYSGKDNVVDVEAIRKKFRQLGAAKKQLSEVKNAENDHVLAGDILSPSGTPEVEKLIAEFVGP